MTPPAGLYPKLLLIAYIAKRLYDLRASYNLRGMDAKMPNESTEEHLRRLFIAIHGFQPVTGSEPWLQEAKAYASAHGEYTIETAITDVTIVVKPERVEWRFRCSVGTDDYFVIVPEPQQGLWSLEYDRYGTGKDFQELYGENVPNVTGISSTRMRSVASYASHLIKEYGQQYLGWPVPAKPSPPMSRDEKHKLIAIIVMVAVLAVCGTCGFSALMVLLFHNR